MARVGLTGGRKGSDGFPQGNPLGGISIRVTWGGAGLHLPSLSLPLPTAPPPPNLLKTLTLVHQLFLLMQKSGPGLLSSQGWARSGPLPPSTTAPLPNADPSNRPLEGAVQQTQNGSPAPRQEIFNYLCHVFKVTQKNFFFKK